jgi:hypothetical protein
MKRTLFFLITFLSAAPFFAQPVVSFTEVSLSGPALDQPVDITGCDDGSGRLFIVEKKGTIRIIQNGVVLDDYFLDIQTQVMNSGERGLLGLVFHPQFPDSPYIYVNYVITGTITNRISRFTLNSNNPNDIVESSELIYLEQTGVQSNHKAGDLAFGPDGYLYFGMGDGGGGGDPSNTGQNVNIWLGKILRIDVNSTTGALNYGIPPDNPFVDTAGLDEIWAYGMRNPWRISFDRTLGDLWIGDVGQNEWEEVDMIPAGTQGGMNFGWDCQEGNHPFQPNNCSGNAVFTWPIFEYPHNCNPCPNGQGESLTGGFVYRGSEYPILQGCYICADYGSNFLWLIKQTDDDPLAFDVWIQDGTGEVNELVSFGEDDNGEMYACNLEGTLYAISGSGFLAIQWEKVSASIVPEGHKIEWTLHQTYGVTQFEIQRSFKSTFEEYNVIAQIQPVADQIIYSYNDPLLARESVYYRIVASIDDGSLDYSPIVKTRPDPTSKPALVLDPISNIWHIDLPDSWQNGEILLYDLQGKEVFKRAIAEDQRIELAAPVIPGCYFVEIRGDMGKWSDKIVW